MAITDLPLFGMLKTKMRWHQARQSVLAQNIANADTPGFRPSDLKPADMRTSMQTPRAGGVTAALTHKAHIAGPVLSGGAFGRTDNKGLSLIHI